MSDSVVMEVLIKTIRELDESGDIVVVNPLENAVAKKLFSELQKVSPNLLSQSELGGIINALRAHKLGFGLDDRDFQTIVGITKEELSLAADKLTTTEW